MAAHTYKLSDLLKQLERGPSVAQQRSIFAIMIHRELDCEGVSLTRIKKAMRPYTGNQIQLASVAKEARDAAEEKMKRQNQEANNEALENHSLLKRQYLRDIQRIDEEYGHLGGFIESSQKLLLIAVKLNEMAGKAKEARDMWWKRNNVEWERKFYEKMAELEEYGRIVRESVSAARFLFYFHFPPASAFPVPTDDYNVKIQGPLEKKEKEKREKRKLQKAQEAQQDSQVAPKRRREVREEHDEDSSSDPPTEHAPFGTNPCDLPAHPALQEPQSCSAQNFLFARQVPYPPQHDSHERPSQPPTIRMQCRAAKREHEQFGAFPMNQDTRDLSAHPALPESYEPSLGFYFYDQQYPDQYGAHHSYFEPPLYEDPSIPGPSHSGAQRFQGQYDEDPAAVYPDDEAEDQVVPPNSSDEGDRESFYDYLKNHYSRK